jgi:heme-degrading monooxygenase HmoA
MKVVLFHTRPRHDINEVEYQRTFERMLELVSAIPGFRSIEGFAGEDGRELAVAWFDSAEAVAEWKRHPEHVATQERGRKEFFAAYDITIAEVDRQYGWPEKRDEASQQQPEAADQVS